MKSWCLYCLPLPAPQCFPGLPHAPVSFMLDSVVDGEAGAGSAEAEELLSPEASPSEGLLLLYVNVSEGFSNPVTLALKRQKNCNLKQLPPASRTVLPRWDQSATRRFPCVHEKLTWEACLLGNHLNVFL